MRSELLLVGAIVLVFAGSLALKKRMAPESNAPPMSSRMPERILSTAPSITETLYALGCGDRVVGVTRYCQYPPEVAKKPRIGGLHDANYEALVALRPDMVVMLAETERMRPLLERLGLRTLAVPFRTAEDILESIPKVGRACGAETTARQIVADIRARIARVRRKTQGLARPRVMVAIERRLGTGRLENVYTAGPGGYFDALIDMAGGQNACQEGKVRTPLVSAEGILGMNPQVVIELVSERTAPGYTDAQILADWQQLPQIEAVKTERVHVVREDFAFIPGPRFVLLVEKLARLLHPEVAWEP